MYNLKTLISRTNFEASFQARFSRNTHTRNLVGETRSNFSIRKAFTLRATRDFSDSI